PRGQRLFATLCASRSRRAEERALRFREGHIHADIRRRQQHQGADGNLRPDDPVPQWRPHRCAGLEGHLEPEWSRRAPRRDVGREGRKAHPLMTWQVWSAFALIETVLCLTPGPAVLLVLSQALTRGTARTIWSILGLLSANT